jgi:hypothetical protein
MSQVYHGKWYDMTQVGGACRPADEQMAVSARDPFVVDPALVERVNRSHAATQNALAAYLERQGIAPRSPTLDEPDYDLA